MYRSHDAPDDQQVDQQPHVLELGAFVCGFSNLCPLKVEIVTQEVGDHQASNRQNDEENREKPSNFLDDSEDCRKSKFSLNSIFFHEQLVQKSLFFFYLFRSELDFLCHKCCSAISPNTCNHILKDFLLFLDRSLSSSLSWVVNGSILICERVKLRELGFLLFFHFETFCDVCELLVNR